MANVSLNSHVVNEIGARMVDDVAAQAPIVEAHNGNAAGITLRHHSGDCILTIPEGAFGGVEEIKLNLDQDSPHLPLGHIPITPVIKLSPCMTLQKKATISVRTWGHNKNIGNAHVYFQKMTNQNNPNWDCVDILQLGQQQFFKFEVKSLCKYCVAVDQADDGMEFVVESCLFYHANGRLINRVIPQCAVIKQRMTLQMAEREYKHACSADSGLVISMGDILSINLTSCQGVRWNFDKPQQECRITDKLLRGIGNTTLNFLLPSDCDGTVDFDHRVVHMRDGNFLQEMLHTDRIVVGKDARIHVNVAVGRYPVAGGTSLAGSYRGRWLFKDKRDHIKDLASKDLSQSKRCMDLLVEVIAQRHREIYHNEPAHQDLY